MEDKIATGVNAAQYVLAAVQTDEVFRWIQLGLAIVCSLVGLAYRIWCWHKNAKKDGKIDNAEISELFGIIGEEAEKLSDDSKKD